jgi:predicted transcriptional regulator of viral defense system
MTRITRTDSRRELEALAARQHGVASREQLRRLGRTDDAIDHAIAVGRLHRVFRGVYAVGRAEIGQRGSLRAATLACGRGAVISHRSAAALLGLLDRGPVVIDVIAPGGRGRGIDGIRTHQVRAPRAEEVVLVDEIPCTSPSRTKVDLAGTISDRALRSCFERSAARGTLDLDAIEAAMESDQRRGAPALKALIAEWRGAAPVARRGRLKSPLEAKILPLVARRGLPAPLANAPVRLADGWIEVDFLWPDQGLVVEADSRDFHSTIVAFERDRRRDRELLKAGYATLRITSRQAETEAAAVTDAVESLLKAQGGPRHGHAAPEVSPPRDHRRRAATRRSPQR